MPNLKLNKGLIYKILLIACLVACTAILIYFICDSAQNIASNNKQLANFELLYNRGELGLSEFNKFTETISQAKQNCVIHIVLCVFCLASFWAVLLYDLIVVFSVSRVENGVNIPRK